MWTAINMVVSAVNMLSVMSCLLSFNNEFGILNQTCLHRLTVNSALSLVQVLSWKSKLPLQTIMRLLQVLVPQVEKICIDKYGNVQIHRYLYIYSFLTLIYVYFPHRGLTDESEILKFLQHGTLVGLLPVPHPILIRKYQANAGTAMWFRTYMWGIVYLR